MFTAILPSRLSFASSIATHASDRVSESRSRWTLFGMVMVLFLIQAIAHASSHAATLPASISDSSMIVSRCISESPRIGSTRQALCIVLLSNRRSSSRLAGRLPIPSGTCLPRIHRSSPKVVENRHSSVSREFQRDRGSLLGCRLVRRLVGCQTGIRRRGHQPRILGTRRGVVRLGTGLGILRMSCEFRGVWSQVDALGRVTSDPVGCVLCGSCRLECLSGLLPSRWVESGDLQHFVDSEEQYIQDDVCDCQCVDCFLDGGSFFHGCDSLSECDSCRLLGDYLKYASRFSVVKEKLEDCGMLGLSGGLCGITSTSEGYVRVFPANSKKTEVIGVTLLYYVTHCGGCNVMCECNDCRCRPLPAP